MKKEICELCSQEVEEVYECDRCGTKVCLECCENDYPYNETICNECAASFEDMLESWKRNEEPVKWKKF